jgi:hypothetical protein
MTTANLDMLRQYRAETNVVSRPPGAWHLAARPARDPVAAPASGGALETRQGRMELAARRGGPRMKPAELQIRARASCRVRACS